jgi:hypothetical protein
VTVIDAPPQVRVQPQAASLRQIQMELTWIGESDSTTDGNLSASIDQYTKKDVYDYVLELDAAGKIVGGEWIGASRINHPDFLWLPVKKSQGTVAGVISYADVKQAVRPRQRRRPAGPRRHGPGPRDRHPRRRRLEALRTVQGRRPGAARRLTLAKGDADLYVRKDAKPTTSSYDCRPYEDGMAGEQCELGAGNWYVSLHGFAATSDFTLDVTRK